jgi:hypothetical protein
MPITPDTKDWTWVLNRPCPDCGYDTSTFEPVDVAAMIRANGAAWPEVLERTDVRERPDADTWSPLEYAAHVRDVIRLMDTRIGMMLETDDPTYPNWDQDETAVRERYGEQDPATVAEELQAAADRFAATLEAVPQNAWSRTGRRGDGATFTVASLAKYSAHDPIHHLWDVRR